MSIEASDQLHHTILDKVLRGDFGFTNKLNVPKSKLGMIVSSTFTDTHTERNVLLEQILPALQSKGRDNEIYVTFVDMRYGMKDANALDQKTWIYCAREVRRCFEESAGMFFLSLQSEKYGYMPIPKYVKETDYHERRELWDEDTITQGEKWYYHDGNAVPSHYILKNLTSLRDNDYWSVALPLLREGLKDISFDDSSGPDIKVYRSVTEWEVTLALRLDPTGSRIGWIHREFLGGVSKKQDERELFCDTHQPNVREKYENLISMMRKKIAPDNIYRFKIPFDSYKEKDEGCQSYLQEWKIKTELMLNFELEAIIQRRNDWVRDGCSYGLPGADLDEMIHHSALAFEKCVGFHGREDLIEKALTFASIGKPRVATVSRAGDDSQAAKDVGFAKKAKTFDGISFCIIGASGSGKTALVSVIAKKVAEAHPDLPVIVRFCGTSEGSADGLVLVRSICLQIQRIYREEAKVTIPVKYEEAVEYFQSLLQKYPVVLFIDSLDQLTDAFLARSQISFLAGVKPHPDTRIIVSALPDERDPVTGDWIYCYQCDTRLLEADVPRVWVSKFEGDDIDKAKDIMEQLLLQKQRRLTPVQWERVISAVKVEPTALYLNLAVRVVSEWTNAETEMKLQPSVYGLINQIFDFMEHDYGQVLTQFAIGFITFSVNGVSDVEMHDLLSLSDEVLDECFQYSQPEGVYRLPFHMWIRWKSAMEGLIVEREGHCLHWFHRQLRETAERRYDDRFKYTLHKIMGKYFSDVVDEDTRVKRLITRQPLVRNDVPVWFQATKVNKRRCEESAYHLIRADMCTEAAYELCSFDVICASALEGLGFRLVNYLADLQNQLTSLGAEMPGPEYEKMKNRCEHYLRWIRQDMTYIAKNPRTNVIASASAQPNVSIVHWDAVQLLQTFRTRKAFSEYNDGLWLRSQTFTKAVNFGPLISTLQGHADRVTSVCLSADGKLIVSASWDKMVRVWDVKTGNCVSTLEGHTSWVKSVSVSADSRVVVSGGLDGLIKVWDVTTGSSQATLRGHLAGVTSLCVSRTGKQMLSGSDDKTAKVWDVKSGSCIRTLEGHSDGVTSVSINADMSLAITGSYDKTARIWDVATGKCLFTLSEHVDGVMSVSMSATGEVAATGSFDRAIKIWNTSTGACTTTMPLAHSHWITSVSMTEDGNTVVSGSEDDTVKVWDAVMGICGTTLKGHSSSVETVFVSGDGKVIVSGSSDYTVRVWDPQGEDPITAGGLERQPSLAQMQRPPSAASTTTDANRPVSPRLSISGKQRSTLSASITAAAISATKSYVKDSIGCVTLSPNGRTVVTGSDDKLIRMWDVGTGTCTMTLKNHTDRVTCVCLSPNGKIMVSGSADKSVRVWDLVTATSTPFLTLRGHGDKVNSVTINSTGKTVVSASDDLTIKIWDAVIGTCLSTLKGHTQAVTSACMSTDDKYVLSGSADCTVKVWVVATGRSIATMRGHTGPITCIFLTNDCSHIISGSRDSSMRIWDVASGATTHTLDAQAPVTSVYLSLDGTVIVSGLEDSSIKIWDVGKGALISTFSGHLESVSSVCMSGDGKIIVSGSQDGRIKLWDAVTQEVVTTRRSILVRQDTNVGEGLRSGDITPNNANSKASSPRGRPSINLPDKTPRTSVFWANDGLVQIQESGAAKRLSGVSNLPVPRRSMTSNPGSGIASGAPSSDLTAVIDAVMKAEKEKGAVSPRKLLLAASPRRLISSGREEGLSFSGVVAAAMASKTVPEGMLAPPPSAASKMSDSSTSSSPANATPSTSMTSISIPATISERKAGKLRKMNSASVLSQSFEERTNGDLVKDINRLRMKSDLMKTVTLESKARAISPRVPPMTIQEEAPKPGVEKRSFLKRVKSSENLDGVAAQVSKRDLYKQFDSRIRKMNVVKPTAVSPESVTKTEGAGGETGGEEGASPEAPLKPGSSFPRRRSTGSAIKDAAAAEIPRVAPKVHDGELKATATAHATSSTSPRRSTRISTIAANFNDYSAAAPKATSGASHTGSTHVGSIVVGEEEGSRVVPLAAIGHSKSMVASSRVTPVTNGSNNKLFGGHDTSWMSRANNDTTLDYSTPTSSFVGAGGSGGGGAMYPFTNTSSHFGKAKSSVFSTSEKLSNNSSFLTPPTPSRFSNGGGQHVITGSIYDLGGKGAPPAHPPSRIETLSKPLYAILDTPPTPAPVVFSGPTALDRLAMRVGHDSGDVDSGRESSVPSRFDAPRDVSKSRTETSRVVNTDLDGGDNDGGPHPPSTPGPSAVSGVGFQGAQSPRVALFNSPANKEGAGLGPVIPGFTRSPSTRDSATKSSEARPPTQTPTGSSFPFRANSIKIAPQPTPSPKVNVGGSSIVTPSNASGTSLFWI